MDNPFESINQKLDVVVQLLHNLKQAQCAPTSSASDTLLNVEQTASYLNLPVKTVYRIVHARKIPHIKLGKRLLFQPQELHQWVAEAKRYTIDDTISEAEALLQSCNRSRK